MNSFWERICNALGMQDWIADPRFASIEKRRDNRAVVNERISGVTAQHTVQDLVALFTEYQVPHAPILGITDALSQLQAVEREMVVEVEHKALGRIPIVNRPIKYGGDKQPAPTAPPVLGEHTDDILTDVLGLSPERIEQLRAAKVVA